GKEQTMQRWRQQLTPTNIDFQGCQVTEAEDKFESNTCWFNGSKFEEVAKITGGTWQVLTNNYWGDDYIGFATEAVKYYRKAGRAPCEAIYYQLMKIVRPGGNVQYAKHRHVWRIGRHTVSSTRG